MAETEKQPVGDEHSIWEDIVISFLTNLVILALITSRGDTTHAVVPEVVEDSPPVLDDGESREDGENTEVSRTPLVAFPTDLSPENDLTEPVTVVVPEMSEEQQDRYAEIEDVYRNRWNARPWYGLGGLSGLSKIPGLEISIPAELGVDGSIPPGMVSSVLVQWGAVFTDQQLLGLIDSLENEDDPRKDGAYGSRRISINFSVDAGRRREVAWHEIAHAIAAHSDHPGLYTLDQLLELELLGAQIVARAEEYTGVDILRLFTDKYKYSNSLEGSYYNPAYSAGERLRQRYAENTVGRDSPIDQKMVATINALSVDGFSEQDNITLGLAFYELYSEDGTMGIDPELDELYHQFVHTLCRELLATIIGKNVRSDGSTFTLDPELRGLVARYLEVAAGKEEGEVDLDELNRLFRSDDFRDAGWGTLPIKWMPPEGADE